jgi:cytochrome c556
MLLEMPPSTKESGMNKKLVGAGLALAVSAAFALPAFGQAKPETLVKQRQAVMVLHGKYWGPLSQMAQGKLPYDANLVARNAGYLRTLSEMPWDGFDPSTRNLKSGVLPAVYDEPAKFKEAADRYRSAVDRLVTVSKSGDEAAVKTALGEVGKSCGGCHDNFREKQ